MTTHTTNAGDEDEDSAYRSAGTQMCMGHTDTEPGEEDQYGVSYCISGQEQDNSGDLLDNHDERVGNVMTHTFNERSACVITSGSVGLNGMFSVDVFGD